MSDDYIFAIEEEYVLVEAATGIVNSEKFATFNDAARVAIGERVNANARQSRVGIATAMHAGMAGARPELAALRQHVATIAGQHGLLMLAAATPETMRDAPAGSCAGIGMSAHDDNASRKLLCGLNVAVELPDADDRVDIMYRMLPYLPLFVALTTSAPFWRVQTSEHKRMRRTSCDETIATGVPELFRRQEDFDAYVAALTRAGVMADSRYVSWALRPAHDGSTLDLRAPDCCARIADSVAIAALYRSLARHLYRNPWANWDISPVTRAIIIENKWRAQRHGMHATFISAHGAGVIGASEMLEQTLDEARPHAEALDCLAEIEHCRAIAGDSAMTGEANSVPTAVVAEDESVAAERTDAPAAVTGGRAEAALQ
ncbi:MAG: carboxylate--amine ligase [Proteobacteria bacterium]|nr:carboxylate--amine ligase [Pseudomonadota bacterium]